MSKYNSTTIAGLSLRPNIAPGAQNLSDARHFQWENMFRRMLTELSISRFKWKGLPDSIDPRFLELTLFRNGLSVFYWDDRFGKYLAMQASQDVPNFQGNYTKFQMHGTSFPSIMKTLEDVVPIYGNQLRLPEFDVIDIYAFRLAMLEVTFDVNARNARRTRTVFADENKRNTMTQTNNAIDRGDPVIFLRDMDIAGAIASVDLGVQPKQLEELDVTTTRQFNKCMNMLGIDTANQDKKERLVSAEVDANSESVLNIRQTALRARQYAADAINAKFQKRDEYGAPTGEPLNVSVEYDAETDKKAAAMPMQLGLNGSDDEGNDDDV